MTANRTLHLNFDRALETLRRGVRRADVFMGVGINASNYAPPISHILAQENSPEIRLVKQELNDDEKAHVAAEFGKWVRASGIRELLETFSVFMHELYSIIFLLKQHQRQLTKALSKCHPRKFELKGIGDQIEQMSNAITIPKDNIRAIRSLNKVRNCYAHRNGLVGAADLDEGTDCLNVSWISLRPQVREPDGNIVPSDKMFGKRFEKGGAIEIVIAERSKSFTAGRELVLEMDELKEICFCVLLIGQNLFKETVDIARNAGVLKEKVDDKLDDPKSV